MAGRKMEPSRLCYIRGYLAVVGASIDAIAEASIAQVPAGTVTQFSEIFHITIVTKDELRESQGKARLEDLKLPMLVDSESIINLGVGRGGGVCFTVVIWKKGAEIRREIGLPPKCFHIALTSKDDHSLDKSARSILRDPTLLPALQFSPNQVSSVVDYTKYLASQPEFTARGSTEVVTILHHISSSESSNADALDLLAVMLFKSKDLPGCLAASEKLISKFPTDPRGYFRSAAYYAHLAKSPYLHTPVFCWKLAMALYGAAVKHALLILENPEDAHFRFSEKLLKEACQAILQCGKYTEFGCLATCAEAEKFPEERRNLLIPWNPGVRSAVLEAFVERGEPHPSTQMLSLESRERLCVYDAKSKDFLVLPRFFRWITPFKLAVMSTPKNAEDIRLLTMLGIGAVVTLTKEEELDSMWFDKVGSVNFFLPVTNYKSPTITQVDHFFTLVDQSVTLVHCGGGKGRAGTFVACYLARYGFVGVADAEPKYSANEIIHTLRQMRPGSIETDEQEQFVTKYVKELWKRAQTGGKLQLIPEPEPEADGGDRPILQIEGRLHPKGKLIVCCGIPGSGKSTVSKNLANAGWTVASQDDTGSRGACEAIVSTAMRQNRPVIVDRCNPTVLDRKAWMDLAMVSPSETTCFFFDYDESLCLQRANLRLDHPTLAGSGVANVVRSMSKSLQRPSMREGFGALVMISNIAAANKLIQCYCGARTNAKNRAEEESKASSSGSQKHDDDPHAMTKFHKFPRTRHLFNFGSATRDDLIMTKSEVVAFFRPEEKLVVTLEEKVDGANLGFSIDPETHQIRAQNRSHFVNSKSHSQFKKLDFWIENHRQDLLMLLTCPEGKEGESVPGSYILFGEWLFATHAIHYSRLPDYFLAFDLYDVGEQKFWSRERFGEAIERTTIQAVPRIPLPVEASEEVFKEMMGRESHFYDGSIEGVYVRRDRGPYLLDRGKVVRSGFISGNAHWSKQTVTENSVRWQL